VSIFETTGLGSIVVVLIGLAAIYAAIRKAKR